jgi:choline dehydrogenase-like flavoprotein
MSSTQAASPQSAANPRDRLLAAAQDPRSTPFDYIVIGSGAGGGTLAARLAEHGRRVLVIEAGADPAVVVGAPTTPVTGGPQLAVREAYAVPGYHGAATEDKDMCWSFSVRHYEDDGLQRRDSKYMPHQDPSSPDYKPAAGSPGAAPTARSHGKGGILYPRSSGLGGCTGHFAMIVIKPNDCDWERIADITGDESWRAARMQGYFGKIENCLYYQSYQGFLRKALLVYGLLLRLVGIVKPRWQLDPGGHGFKGWQTTNFIEPELVLRIAWRDGTFLRLLFGVFRYLWTRKGQLRALFGSLLRLQVVQYLDPNFGTRGASHAGRTAFIPIATYRGARSGLRERLQSVAAQFPDRLVLLTGALASRLIFRERCKDSPIPRVGGVEVQLGLHLFEPSPRSPEAPAQPPTCQFFAREEVIVAGGAFNTPQLLMLSGIGDARQLRELGIAGPRDASGHEVANVIDLPGVGRNLQDRYEVSVISQTRRPFSTLRSVSFKPGDPTDRARRQWLEQRQGLYATNGGAVAFFFKSSQATNDEPDVFIFGAPAAFRGYYWGWSKELLRAGLGATHEQRDLWSWILLKAYTRNHGGTVRLRNASPRSQPEITFNSFDTGCAPGEAAADSRALTEAVQFVRDLNKHVGVFRSQEIQPGALVDDPKLKGWVENEAWGHHACGTCRMGVDPWRADVAQLGDRDAVLDSRFRVQGVAGLRVVDTSIFPEIPGYFIVTPTFMIGEKAADTLIADSATYPQALEEAEAQAVAKRRRAAGMAAEVAAPPSRRLPADAVGLALSGGGVRSATFCLGVLQSLARKGLLARLDFLSTVSGGGYVGAFLGRLFSRTDVPGRPAMIGNPVQRVSEILSNTASAEIWWLRSHARYLTGAGRTDLETNTGTVWRNLLSVHVCIALLVLGVELLLCWVGMAANLSTPPLATWRGLPNVTWSAWWWTPFAVLCLAVLPVWIGFWLAPKPKTTASLSFDALFIWILALIGAVAVLARTTEFALPLAVIFVLLLAWVWQEVAVWGMHAARNPTERGTIARNRLTRGAGIALALLGATVLWVLIDTFADYAAHGHQLIPVSVMGVVAAFLPMLRTVLIRFVQQPRQKAGYSSGQKQATLLKIAGVGAIAFGLAGLLVLGLDVIAHWAFIRLGRGEWFLAGCLALSLAIGRATGIVNLSSLQSLYAARLARTYLGAANEERLQARGSSEPRDVDAPRPNDDTLLQNYHPERQGGPLHLINVCVNETVDVSSGRQLAEDKGLSMCVGPSGVSVGVRFHALWDALDPQEQEMEVRMQRALENPVVVADATPASEHDAGPGSTLRALPTGPDPEAFHVLASRRRERVAVESMRLSQWIGISGASVSPGQGRQTTLPLALLLGLFNVRLGYWWNSRINAGDRPGRYPPSLWRRIKSIPGFLFRTQSLILNEWRGYFAGPSQRSWYLSDGGHSENTGLYELIRRRLPFIIAVDGAHDPGYAFDDLGLLERRVRLDFGANFTWFDPTEGRRNGARGWDAFCQTSDEPPVPGWIRTLLNPDALGSRETLTRSGLFAAAVARIDYDGSGCCSWLVLLKAALASPPPLPVDVSCYAKANTAFPNQSTLDQFFSDDQWESYRILGERLAASVLA